MKTARYLLLGLFLFACASPSESRNNIANPDAGEDASHDFISDTTEEAGTDVFVPPEEVWPPERVHFRTATRSFNRRYYVALHEGQIWVKPNEEMTGTVGEWQLLGTSGRPEGAQFTNFGTPSAVSEISADGVHLMAIDPEGHFYRGSDLTQDVSATFTWTDRWGGVLADGTGMTTQFSTARGWAVADSHPLGVEYYTDIDGTDHSVGLGVAHIYRLGDEGFRLFFNDWWLPNDWSRQICTPERGTFPAVNMSASASTIMLIGPRGRIFTRLYDFDTGGENPLLEYSYIIEGASGTTRKLPSEPWLEQPPVTDGFITKRITIFQNGTGNTARTLRVEGIQGGVTGYFEKEIYDPQWQFVPTYAPRSNPIINDADNLPPLPPARLPDDYSLRGTLTKNGQTIEVELTDFNIICSPARARLYVNGALVTAGQQPFTLEFHHVHTMVDEIRPLEYWLLGMQGKIQAALLLKGRLDEVDDVSIRTTLSSFFTGQDVINFVGFAGLNSLEAEEIPWDMPFRVPGDEKSFLTGFTLSLARTP